MNTEAMDAMVQKKVQRLSISEKIRMAKIMKALAVIIEGMVTCEGPDDAKIATVCAITTVFGLQVLPQPSHFSQGKLAEICTDFIIEALIARRRSDEYFQTRGK